MRLVGATNRFIRGPFLLEGAVKGLFGGLLSLVLCYAGFRLFRDSNLGTLGGLVFFRPDQMGMLVCSGRTRTVRKPGSVGRHLRNV